MMQLFKNRWLFVVGSWTAFLSWASFLLCWVHLFFSMEVQFRNKKNHLQMKRKIKKNHECKKTLIKWRTIEYIIYLKNINIPQVFLTTLSENSTNLSTTIRGNKWPRLFHNVSPLPLSLPFLQFLRPYAAKSKCRRLLVG